MKSKGLLKSLGVVVLALVIGLAFLPGCAEGPAPEEPAPPAPEEPKKIVWKVHTGAVDTYYLGAELHYLADLVKEKTDGQLELEIFYGAALGYEGAEVMDALKDGALEVSELGGPILAGEVAPWWSFLDFSSMFDNWDQLMYVWEKMDPLFNESIAAYGGVKALATHNGDCADEVEGFFLNKKLESWDDMKGLKIRLYFPLAREYQFKPLGLEAIYIPMPETYYAMKTGVVDGIHQCPSGGVSNNYYDIADYFYVWDTPIKALWGLLYSEKALAALPQDLQKAVLEAGKEYEYWVRNDLQVNWCDYTSGVIGGEFSYGGWMCDTEALAILEEEGVQVYRLDQVREEMMRLGEEGLKKWGDEKGYPEVQAAYEYMLEAKELFPGTTHETYLKLENVVLTGMPPTKK